MRKLLILVLIFLSFVTLSQQRVGNNSYQKGEKLKYRVHYGWVTGGYAQLEVKDDAITIDNKNCMQIIISGYTVGLTDWVFKVKDKYESFVDENTLLPVKHIRNIREGNYKRYNEVTFDRTNNTATSQKTGLHQLPPEIHDIISGFYYARSHALNKCKQGDTLIIQTFFDDELFPLAVINLGKENIETDLGTFRCIKLRPLLQKGRIFKSNDDMSIWVSDDDNHIPVLIESELLVGALKFDLIEYKGLKNQLSSITETN